MGVANRPIIMVMAAVQLEASSERWATLLLFREVENSTDILTAAIQGNIRASILDPAVVSQTMDTLSAVSNRFYIYIVEPLITVTPQQRPSAI